MIAAVLAGCLAVVTLASVRIRPDHRLRDAPATAPGTRPISVPPDHRMAEASTARPRVRSIGLRRVPARCGSSELAAWCDALARDVRSGASLHSALRSGAPPAGTVFAEIQHRLDRGVPLGEALAVAAATSDEHAVLVVLSACADHGGPAAQPLDRVAATLRRRAADDAERAVQSSQARLSASVMTVLPGAVLVLLLATSSSVRTVALTSFGAVVVVLGLGLNLLGWWWMRRIIAGGRR